jgi:hypothetical protein
MNQAFSWALLLAVMLGVGRDAFDSLDDDDESSIPPLVVILIAKRQKTEEK